MERLSKELIPPTGKYPEDVQAFQTIKGNIEKKFSALRFSLAQNNPQYWAIQGKLDEPYQRKNVELVMHRLLQNDLDVLKKLKKTSTAVLKNTDVLRVKIEVPKMPKRIFTAREVRDNLFHILYKNLKIALEYEEAKKRIGDLYKKLQEAKKRFNAFDEGYRSLKQNRVYRVIPPESNSHKTSALKENELAKIIADALLGEPSVVQLVARSYGNNLEMEKDWEMMTEFDKDELINKKMVREL